MKPISTFFHQLGLRMTASRKHIFAGITDHPQTVGEIADGLKQHGVVVDTTTIYRTVERFVTLGLVSRTQFQDGIMRYERNEMQHHHHHLICDKCGKVTDIELDEHTLLAHVPETHGFKIQRHCLEFFGLCKKCQHTSL